MNGLSRPILVSLFVILAWLMPSNVHAAYVIYKCQTVYTNSGAGWVPKTNCVVDRVVGKPSPQEGYESMRKYLPPIYWMINGDGTKTEVQPSDLVGVVQQCLDNSFAEMRTCKRWVGAGAGAVGCYLLTKRAGKEAFVACEIGVALGANEAFLQCDSSHRERDKTCAPPIGNKP